MKHSYQNYPAWANGTFCQVKDLTVSILDLGLTHSDATYDVMAFINNKGLRIEDHMDRFIKSCEYWRISLMYTKQELIDIVTEVHDRADWPSSIIWLSITRGIPESGNPRDLQSCSPNIMCYAKPYQLFNGTNLATVCLARQRRVPDNTVNQQHKNFVRVDTTRAQWEAIDQGYTTAILLSTDGFLSEGPGFNAAIVKDNTVLAPRTNCLPGISMLLVEEACRKNDIKFVWSDIDEDTLTHCDDMFLTTTVGNVVTVTNYNGRDLAISEIQKTIIETINN